jgi:pyrimidine-nucleoside phosphorylase
MVETGERMGKSVVALITNMDQPLGTNVGNSLEVAEAIKVLRGEGPEDLRELCTELAARMFQLGGAADTVVQGKALAEQLIASGKALDRFRQMVILQGGDARVIDDPGLLPRANLQQEVKSAHSGHVGSIDCEAVGHACVILGGGREKKEDAVDPAVGIVFHRKLGDAVATGEPLCTVHANSETRAARAIELLLKSYRITEAPPAQKKLIHRVIRGSGV